MSGKSHAISVRLSQDDYEFLASCDWNGASTLSEKVRELVSQAREQAELGNNPVALYAPLSTGLHRLMDSIHQLESEQGIHSDLMQNMLLLIPQLFAALPQQSPCELAELAASEKALADLMFRFLSSLVRLALTPQGPCYDPELVVTQLQTIKPTLDALLSLPHIKSV